MKPINRAWVQQLVTFHRYKFVKSHYLRTWTGIVIDKKKRHGMGDLLLILVIKDRNGNTPRKRLIKILDEAWITYVPAVDITAINPYWFFINEQHPAVKHRAFFN